MRHAFNPDDWLIAIFCAITAVITIVPILRYLARPWGLRRRDLCHVLAGGGIVAYYQNFRAIDLAEIESKNKKDKEGPSLTEDEERSRFAQQLQDHFESKFTFWHGSHFYHVPTCVLAILSVASAWWSFFNLRAFVDGTRKLDSMHALVQCALGGAFVWIISDEVGRLRRRDFTPSDVYYYAFRILLSIPFGWAITRMHIQPEEALPTAFFLGTFPTTTLFTFARRFVSAVLKVGDISDGTSELEQLPSIGKDNAERFKDEGYSTISNLACADPVTLTIDTNFDFQYVLECISQAILWLYIPPTEALNKLGIRGAKEVAKLQSMLDENPQPLDAVAAITAAAGLLNISVEALGYTLAQIRNDDRTRFICQVIPVP